MRILLINPAPEHYTRAISLPLGIFSIASYLESLGITVKLYDRTVNKSSIEQVLD